MLLDKIDIQTLLNSDRYFSFVIIGIRIYIICTEYYILMSRIGIRRTVQESSNGNLLSSSGRYRISLSDYDGISTEGLAENTTDNRSASCRIYSLYLVNLSKEFSVTYSRSVGPI